MTEIEYLDFEKPIEDLMLNLQQAEQLGREGIEVKQTISDLKKKLEAKKKPRYILTYQHGKGYNFLVIHNALTP